MSLIPQNLTAVLFDLGGVIVNIDYDKTAQAFETIGFENFRDHMSAFHQKETFDLYEKGLITDHQFRQAIQEEFEISVTDDQFDQAWNSMILDIPPDRFDILLAVRQRVPIYLLSNTNAIHIRYFNQVCVEPLGIPSLASKFDHLFYSFEMGMRKPDHEIYQKVISEIKREPTSVLFLDDNPTNIQHASEFGIQTIRIANGLTISDIFGEWL